MKTKFITTEIFIEDRTLKESFEIFEKYFSANGWYIDLDNEEMFITIDKEINLNEGDRIDLHGYRKITWKCYNIIEDTIEYYTKEE